MTSLVSLMSTKSPKYYECLLFWNLIQVLISYFDTRYVNYDGQNAPAFFYKLSLKHLDIYILSDYIICIN